MKIFSNLNARIKAYREEHMGEDGFSLLELVVAVGVLLALSVGGFLAYSGITENAKSSAVQSAASTVLSAAVAYEADGDSTTGVDSGDTGKKADEEYNASSEGRILTQVTKTGDVLTVTAFDTDGGKIAAYADQTNAKLKASRTTGN